MGLIIFAVLAIRVALHVLGESELEAAQNRRDEALADLVEATTDLDSIDFSSCYTANTFDLLDRSQSEVSSPDEESHSLQSVGTLISLRSGPVAAAAFLFVDSVVGFQRKRLSSAALDLGTVAIRRQSLNVRSELERRQLVHETLAWATDIGLRQEFPCD